MIFLEEPYFMENPDWYYIQTDTFPWIKIKESAPERAKESYYAWLNDKVDFSNENNSNNN